jgi:hypothetical protein
MKNEELNVVVMDNEISVIEENHHNAILSIHENMQQLVADCNDIKVVEDDKETYDRAVELKRVVKSTHVAIEKKRKELKQPLIDYGKRLDKWVEGIYSPLVQAEKLVKQKMEVYEAKQEILKAERKELDDKQKEQEQEIEDKLKNLNATLGMINSASSKNELNEINSSLDKVVLSEYGKKSDEAGFILNQLKLTCSMALRLMKDEEEKPVIAPKLETTPITDDFLKELKEMSAEPTKKVIVEETKDEITEQEVINTNYDANTPFDSTKEPIVADDDIILQELTDISDDDILLFIEEISTNLMSTILPLITDYSNDYLTKVKDKNISDFQKSLIIEESLKRVGAILLKKR